MKSAILPLLLSTLPALLTAVPAAAVEQPAAGIDAESQLVEALDAIQNQKVGLALKDIETLTRENPKFRLAQLVYGDVLLAMAGDPVAGIGANSRHSADAEAMNDLRDEAQARWRHHRMPGNGRLPANLLELAPEQRHAVVVDLLASRLYLFENDGHGLTLKRHVYATQGKNGADKQTEGDKRTPIGVYRVVRHIPDEKLPDLYGAGAFPVDYPNEWDRRLGKTGHGIWLHGNPSDTFSRPPRASDGCVTVTNADLERIQQWIDIGTTPVVIGNGIEWVEPKELARRRDHFRKVLEQWRHDWESLDSDRYLSHYSHDFSDGRKDYAAWSSHKRRVNAEKRYIRVKLEDVSFFRYPDSDPMMVVDFVQDYHSSNYSGSVKKRQFWKREADGQWRIVYEG
ncbi:L,D-transpeptidase family protein [Endothiovibrio diazotrophicus]